MKKKIITLLILIDVVLILIGLSKISLSYIDNKNYQEKIQEVVMDITPKMNNNLVGYIKIGNIKTILMQGSDNKYYLNHDNEDKESKFGSVFVDYRYDLNNGKKGIIYGHSSKIYDLPFNSLKEFKNNNYLDANKDVEVMYKGIINNYEIVNVRDTIGEDDYLYIQTCDQETKGLIIIVAKKI